MRKVFFSFLFLVFCVSFSSAQLLPAVPRKTGVVLPSPGGIARITALASDLGDIICWSGSYQAQKYFPLNVRWNNYVSAWWIKIVGGCSGNSLPGWTYTSSGNHYTYLWGSGATYTHTYTSLEDCSGSYGVIKITDPTTAYNSGCLYGSAFWLTATPPDGSKLMVTGRRYTYSSWSSGNSTCCNSYPCNYCTYSTVVSDTGTLSVVLSTAELTDIYLPNPFPVNWSNTASGNFSDFGDTSGKTYGGGVPGSIAAANTYNTYLAGGAVQLNDSDVQGVQPGVDVSTSIYAPPTTSTSAANFDLSPVTSRLDIANGHLLDIFNKNSSVDLSTTNSLLSSIDSKLSSMTTVAEFSSSAYWSQYQDFYTAFSTTPANFWAFMIPQSTATWEPCFDLSSLWSGVWAGSKPQGASSTFCLTQFSGWNTFVDILKCFIFFFFTFLGAYGIWGVIRDIRVPGVLSGGWTVLGVALAGVSVGITFWLYQYVFAWIIQLGAFWANCAGACQGLMVVQNPGALILMMNYTGVTTGLQIWLSLMTFEWQVLLFLNFWGAIKK